MTSLDHVAPSCFAVLCAIAMYRLATADARRSWWGVTAGWLAVALGAGWPALAGIAPWWADAPAFMRHAWLLIPAGACLLAIAHVRGHRIAHTHMRQASKHGFGRGEEPQP